MFSDPVVGDSFFGRQAVLDLLIKRANGLKSGYRQNVALIGHRQVGKTSILRQFLHVHRDPDVLCVYVEIKLQALDYFVDQFVRSLLYQQLTLDQTVDPTESLASLVEKARPKLPKTAAKIAEITALLKARHREDAYSRLFELTSVIAQETGKKCIVILDEFHRLGEFGIKNAFSDFGKRIMVQKETMYLLSSSAFTASRKILAEKLALLFGHFERVYLDNFDFETSFRFVEKKLGGLSIDEGVKGFIVAFTDGHPFFLETTTSRIREIALARGESEVSRDAVAEALLRLLFESQGVFHQYFLKLMSPWTSPESHGAHLLILLEMARGKNKLKDLAKALNRSQKEVSADLKDLLAHEIIGKTGVFYRFHNRIFRFWLREVYEKKELSLLGAGGKVDEFLAHAKQTISEYEDLVRMDEAERVVKLFGLFRNEIVELGERKRQLPHFTEFLKGPSDAPDGSSRAVIAKGHGRCWVCKIVKERATEKEVAELIEDAGRTRVAAATRVLVSLQGLDDNAKLLAKEKKVLTLGLSRINLLMDVFGKTPIVPARIPDEAAAGAA